MADEVAESAKMMRPNDLCSAAFFGDVEKIKELLAVEPVEEEPPIEAEFDPLAPVDEEAIAAAADRKARRQANEKEIAQRLSTNRRIVTRLSAVNVETYGMFATATEQLLGDGTFTIMSRIKTSKRSPFGASPLHWAVLGREHAAIEALILAGADVAAVVPELELTIDDIIRVNELKETAKVVARAIKLRAERHEAEASAAATREAVLADRERQRLQAQEDLRRKEEEERLEAERQAAAEAAGEDTNAPVEE